MLNVVVPFESAVYDTGGFWSANRDEVPDPRDGRPLSAHSRLPEEHS